MIGIVALASVVTILLGFRHRKLRILGIMSLVLTMGFVGGFLSREPYRQYAWKRHFSQLRERFQDSPAPDIQSKFRNEAIWQVSDARGKWLLLDFWASWCGPCDRIVPIVKEAHSVYGHRSDFQMVSVALD